MQSEPLSEKASQTLLNLVKRKEKVAKLSNADLSQVLIDLTGEHSIDSYFFLVLMEAAERLNPEGFTEAAIQSELRPKNPGEETGEFAAIQ